jgi:hypothetical protein
MAITLANAQALSQDKLVKGIIEEVRKSSPFLDKLSFVNTTGNALKVVRESDTMGSAGFIGANDVITSTEATFDTDTYALYLAATQADVPNMYRAVLSDFNDQMKAQVKVKSKKLAWLIENQLYYGVAASSNGFDGLQTMAAETYDHTFPRQFVAHADGSTGTEAVLTMLRLDAVIDSFRGGLPDVMFMSKTLRRYFASYLRTVGQIEVGDRNEWGQYFDKYRGIPIVASDLISDTEQHVSLGTAATVVSGETSTSIFFVRFGDGDGVTGIQNGSIKTEYFDTLEDKDCSRVRMKWYVGLAAYALDSFAVMVNVDPNGTIVSGL